MIKKNKLFQYGLIIGMALLILQGILMNKIGIPILLSIYLIIIIILILQNKIKILLGIIVGYILAITIFIGLIYLIYNILLFFTRL